MLLIDGYNLLHAYARGRADGDARERLINLICDYCRRGGYTARIVFDPTGDLLPVSRRGPVEILSMREGRKADDEILETMAKTGDRTAEDARRSLEHSLERMQVDQIDLIQLHNLVDEEGWQTAFAPGGAVEGLAEARDQGLVRFIGVTGHGTRVAAMHLRSLERFPFDSVLLPYNFTMMGQAEYAADFEALIATCVERRVAVQTIKSIARRRWEPDDTSRRYSWYEPLRDPAAIRRAVHFVLRRPGLFLNTSSDATLLRTVLEAAAEAHTTIEAGVAADSVSAESFAVELEADVVRYDVQPLFIRDLAEGI